MNPPYGRVRLTTEDRLRFAESLYGHANLYGMFLAAATDVLRPGGVIAALIPTSFTAGRYFEPLRKMLSTRVRLRGIAFVEDRSGVFTSVLQETCLATFTTKRIRKTTIQSIGSETTYVSTVKTPNTERPWILPRRSDLAPVAAGAAQLPLTFTTAGWRVSTGPLVWNRRKNDLHSRPGNERYPIIWAADIDGGTLHRDRSRAATRYLATESGADRRTMLLKQPCVLVQRTTAPEQNRRLVAADLSEQMLQDLGGAVVAENHVNVLRSTNESPFMSRELVARLLATDTLDRLVRCMSGSVAISAYELESLPLPSRDVLAAWEKLEDADLEAAVASTYTGAGQS